MKLISKNQSKEINKLIGEAKKSVKIVSPFLSDEVINDLIANTKCKKELITRVDFKDLLNNANSLTAIETMVNNEAKVYSIKHLHTKLIIIDDAIAIMGSANFTAGGLYKNVELSLVLYRNDNKAIFNEILDYYIVLRNTAIKDPQGVITNLFLNKIKSQFKITISKYKPSGNLLYLPCYGANFEDKGVKSNKTIINVSKHNNQSVNSPFYVLNTNETYQKDRATNDMLEHQKASCFGPARPKIDRLKIGDVVFLYKNGCGVVACGVVNSKTKKRGNEAYVELSKFIKFPDKADMNPPFHFNRNTLYVIKDYESAEEYYKNLLETYYHRNCSDKCTFRKLHIKNGTKIYFKYKDIVKIGTVIKNDKNMIVIDGEKPKVITNLTKELREKDTNVHPFDYWYLNKDDKEPLSCRDY